MHIYSIRNNINGKIYIGKSRLNVNENYFGSGLRIKRAIKKYGKENFTKNIICFAENYDELNKMLPSKIPNILKDLMF